MFHIAYIDNTRSKTRNKKNPYSDRVGFVEFQPGTDSDPPYSPTPPRKNNNKPLPTRHRKKKRFNPPPSPIVFEEQKHQNNIDTWCANFNQRMREYGLELKLAGIKQAHATPPHGVFEPQEPLYLDSSWNPKKVQTLTPWPAVQMAREMNQLVLENRVKHIPDILWTKPADMNDKYWKDLELFASTELYDLICNHHWEKYKLLPCRNPFVHFMNISSAADVRKAWSKIKHVNQNYDPIGKMALSQLKVDYGERPKSAGMPPLRMLTRLFRFRFLFHLLPLIHLFHPFHQFRLFHILQPFLFPPHSTI